jgi:acyl-CoA thioester hydrolase
MMYVMKKTRTDFPFLWHTQTRWADNDMYGHVNNVVYYSFFDSAVNQLLIQHCAFHPQTAAQIGLVVQSSCQFLQEMSYPETIGIAVAIQKIGTSSLHYNLAIFKEHQEEPIALGQFVHVFVDRITRKSTPISNEMRRALNPFLVTELL